MAFLCQHSLEEAHNLVENISKLFFQIFSQKMFYQRKKSTLSFLLLLSYLKVVVSVTANEFIYPIPHRRIHSYTFTLTEGPLQPDNFRQNGYLINGEFPGPTIFCNQYDVLEVTVINKMSEPSSIHFHGLLQSQTVASDGVPFITQAPIMPNGTYVYEIEVGTQTGTFMYHGHFGYDIVFIHGALIIRNNPQNWVELGWQYEYDAGCEHIFLLEAIYHYSLSQFYSDVIGPFRGRPPVMSLPISGHSYGEWGGDSGDAPGYKVYPVVRGKMYRFRLINVAADSFLRFRIEGHSFRIIEMDGILTLPVWADHIEVNGGQRYSILVEMDNDPGNYWIHSEIIGGGGGPDNGRAILSYEGAPDPGSMRTLVFGGKTGALNATTRPLSELRVNTYLHQTEVYPVPRGADRRILVDFDQKLLPDGRLRFLVNGKEFEQPERNLLEEVRDGVDIAKKYSHVFPVHYGERVDLVFQNRAISAGICLQHPMHLHGHSFWIVAQGPDTVNLGKVDGIIRANIGTGNLQFRDVFTMTPSQRVENKTGGAGCGWAVIRFVADNPGLWLGHCHINTHMLIGKMFVLYEFRRGNEKLINE